MWTDYIAPGGTFRENLHRRPGKPLLPEEHPAAQFRYNKLKKFADQNGDVTIDVTKKTEEPREVPEVAGIVNMIVPAQVEVKA